MAGTPDKSGSGEQKADPRLAVSREPSGVDQETAVFSVRDAASTGDADEAGDAGDERLRAAVAAWVSGEEPPTPSATANPDDPEPSAADGKPAASALPKREVPAKADAEASGAAAGKSAAAGLPKRAAKPEADAEPVGGEEPQDGAESGGEAGVAADAASERDAGSADDEKPGAAADAEPADDGAKAAAGAASEGDSGPAEAESDDGADAKPGAGTTTTPERDAAPADDETSQDGTDDAEPSVGETPEGGSEPDADAASEDGAESGDAKAAAGSVAVAEPVGDEAKAAADVPSDGEKPKRDAEPADAASEADAAAGAKADGEKPADAEPKGGAESPAGAEADGEKPIDAEPKGRAKPADDGKPVGAASKADAKPAAGAKADGESADGEKPVDAAPKGGAKPADDGKSVDAAHKADAKPAADTKADAAPKAGAKPAVDAESKADVGGGRAGDEADGGGDQPTAVFKAVAPPVDQPTTTLKAAGTAKSSKFVPLKSLDEGKELPPEAEPQPTVEPAERTTQQPLPPKPPLDLLAELTNTPPPPETRVRTVVRRVKVWTPIVILLVIVFAVVQAVRPLPTPTLALTADATYTFDGDKASLPWPGEGQGWMDVQGIGTMDHFGKQTPVPIGSVAKSMTAYIILKDHPLKQGADGPSIDIDATAEKEGGYDADGQNESTLNTVKEGDKISEKDALAAIMIPSANNIARLLARWDAGSEEAFVKKMNATAKKLGMKNTTYTDPSGLKESTVSTAEDQVKLGNELVQIPALTDITKLPTWTDPSGKKWTNYNRLVPYDGAIGIKTGTTTKAGGNLLFAATKDTGGETVTVVGAVLGQHKAPIIDTVNAVSKTAMIAAQDAVTSSTVLKKGDVVGYVDDQLGGHTPITVTKDVKAVGWAGKTVHLQLAEQDGRTVPHTGKPGDRVGVLEVGDGEGGAVEVPVALQESLTEPGFGAKLTRVG